MSYGVGDRRPLHGAGEEGRDRDDPRGLQPRPGRRRWPKKPASTGSYLEGDASTPSTSTRPSYGGKDAKNLEGFLFPDTFELKPGAPVADLVQLQLEDFKRRIKGVDMSYAKSKNLTVYDVVTIASMIEREAACREGAPAGRRGDLQPPRTKACRSGSTRRPASRPATTKTR